MFIYEHGYLMNCLLICINRIYFVERDTQTFKIKNGVKLDIYIYILEETLF